MRQLILGLNIIWFLQRNANNPMTQTDTKNSKINPIVLAYCPRRFFDQFRAGERNQPAAGVAATWTYTTCLETVICAQSLALRLVWRRSAR